MVTNLAVLTLSVLVAAASAAVLHSGAIIPTYAEVCYRDDPTRDLNECLVGSIQTLIKKISGEGIRELGLPPLDPWRVEKASVTLGSGDPFKVSMTTLDADTYGFSRIQIYDVRMSLDNPKRITLEVDFSNKKVFIEGNYEAEGSIADFPILAKGAFNLSMSDLSGTFKMKGHLVSRDGEQYLMVDRASMRPYVGNMTFFMTNDNSKYPELTALFIGLVNQFWKSIYTETLPYAEENFDQVIRPIFNLATLKIPFNQLIPPYIVKP
ncbi:protein takeout [Halyomorpha halys]|uniref:protein takeout n=1 Tax=Halyomorpha halys TaxID=286706 RepID=UPI0006D52448|nr:uncharacterized protein LOC106683918 [Halyomorpha halys]